MDVPGRRWFAVVDGQGQVRLQFTQWPDPWWAGWHALVLTSQAAPAEHLKWLRERKIPYLVAGTDHVDLPATMQMLGDRLDVRTVVCTGGARLGGALLRVWVVDEIDVDVLPTAIGGRGTPALFDAPPLAADEWPTPLELLSAEQVSDDPFGFATPSATVRAVSSRRTHHQTKNVDTDQRRRTIQVDPTAT